MGRPYAEVGWESRPRYRRAEAIYDRVHCRYTRAIIWQARYRRAEASYDRGMLAERNPSRLRHVWQGSLHKPGVRRMVMR